VGNRLDQTYKQSWHALPPYQHGLKMTAGCSNQRGGQVVLRGIFLPTCRAPVCQSTGSRSPWLQHAAPVPTPWSCRQQKFYPKWYVSSFMMCGTYVQACGCSRFLGSSQQLGNNMKLCSLLSKHKAQLSIGFSTNRSHLRASNGLLMHYLLLPQAHHVVVCTCRLLHSVRRLYVGTADACLPVCLTHYSPRHVAA
jgi:hypothetical protein